MPKKKTETTTEKAKTETGAVHQEKEGAILNTGVPAEEPAQKEDLAEKTETKAEPAKRTGTVIDGNLNIRQEPDIESPRVGQLENGSRVAILEDAGDWFKTEHGYVMARYIKLDPAE